MDWNFLIRNKESLLVSTDTRNLPAGCVFFALHGERFDGNKFAKQALESGASLAVVTQSAVQNGSVAQSAVQSGSVLVVEDTLLALQDLARAWRRELGLPIIGITGTNGKTTTTALTGEIMANYFNNSSDWLSVPTTGATSVSMQVFSICIDGADADRRTPYRPPCLTISGSFNVNSSISGITIP